MYTFEEIREKLRDRTVGIAGCGGLGSNCAVALARTGIGGLVIADFDQVSLANLNRQYFFRDQIGQNKALALRDNIRRIDPDVRVIAHDIKLDAAAIMRVFAECDVIVEAFDLAEMKHMLIETIMEGMPGRHLVSGVGLAGWGRIESLQIRRWGNLTICGDGVSEVSPTLPPLAPRVGIVSHMEADTVLQILLEELPQKEKA